MSLPVTLLPDAEADVRETTSSHDHKQAGLGGRFVKRLREALGLIEAMPAAYGKVWRRVRAARLKKFPHVVFYIAYADRVEVIAVVHGSRDAVVWRGRV